MSTSKELDSLKRKIYLAYHRDGILDLTAAMILLGFSIFMATNNVVFLGVGVIFASQYVILKQKITVPRYGYVRFVSQKKALKNSWLLVSLGVLLLFTIFFLNTFVKDKWSSPEIQMWLEQYHMVPLSALLFGMPALIAAIFLGLKRFYLYALLLVVLPYVGALLSIDTFVPILAAGSVILTCGIGLLYSFIKKSPIDKKVDSNVAE